MNQYRTAIENVQELLGNMLDNQAINQTHYDIERYALEKAARSINYYRFMWEERIVGKPVELIDKIIENFEDKNRTFYDNYNQFLLDMNDVFSFVGQTERAWDFILKAKDKAINYLTDSSIHKTDLATEMTSKLMEENIRQLEIFMSEARARSHMIVDSLSQLRTAYKALWYVILSEESVHEFYAKVNEDVTNAIQNATALQELQSTFTYMTKEHKMPFLKTSDPMDLFISMNADYPTISYKERTLDISKQFKAYEGLVDMASDLEDLDATFFKATEKLQLAFEEFLIGNKVDTEFFRYLDFLIDGKTT